MLISKFKFCKQKYVSLLIYELNYMDELLCITLILTYFISELKKVENKTDLTFVMYFDITQYSFSLFKFDKEKQFDCGKQ